MRHAKISQLIARARSSRWSLWLLNTILRRQIPFNRPHGLRVSQILDDSVEVTLPVRRANRNHLRGIHACALAAASEFCTGILLLGRLDPAQYRLVLESFEMDYHYRASGEVRSRCQFPAEQQKTELLDPLETDGVVSVTLESLTYDGDGNHICTARVSWHIKEWVRVREGASPKSLVRSTVSAQGADRSPSAPV